MMLFLNEDERIALFDLLDQKAQSDSLSEAEKTIFDRL